MTDLMTIDELRISSSLDTPQATDFRSGTDVRSMILVIEVLGPAAYSDTPAERLADVFQ